MNSISRRCFFHQTKEFTAVACATSLMPALRNELFAASEVAQQDSWTIFRGNTFATGEAKSCLSTDLTILWQYEVENGAFEATPVIVDSVCFIPDLDGVWHALNLNDGTLKWKKKTEAFGFVASPAFKDGRLYVGDLDGIFYCYDLDGNEKWKFEAQAEISSSANFYEGKVLFGSQDATLYCLDSKTGKLAWKIEVDDQIRCSPTIVEDRSFVAGCDGRLHIIALKKGEEVAQGEIQSPTGVTPAVMGDHVYFGTEGGDFFNINWRNA